MASPNDAPHAQAEYPEPFPEPPDDLARRDLPLREFSDPVWYHDHKKRHSPLHFNRTSGRFASPNDEFGTLYLGEDPFISFIEAFSQEILSRAAIGPMISLNRLQRCCLCSVSAARSLRLVDLTNGPALLQLATNADNRINDGSHIVSQRWARSFWDHPSQPDGLFYRSRRSPERHAIALFDRVEPDLTSHRDENLLSNTDRLATILDYYGCALIP